MDTVPGEGWLVPSLNPAGQALVILVKVFSGPSSIVYRHSTDFNLASFLSSASPLLSRLPPLQFLLLRLQLGEGGCS